MLYTLLFQTGGGSKDSSITGIPEIIGLAIGITMSASLLWLLI